MWLEVATGTFSGNGSGIVITPEATFFPHPHVLGTLPWYCIIRQEIKNTRMPGYGGIHLKPQHFGG